MQRAQLLRQLVLDSQYVVDEQRVARAILARASIRRLVAGVSFRNETPRIGVRSFRWNSQVRSFRPSSLYTSTDGRAGGARRLI